MAAQVWRYSVPNTDSFGGWAILFLDSAGCLAVLSDYGNWSYRWSMHGEPQPMREMVLLFGDSYLGDKLDPHGVFDMAATLESAKEQILEYRRGGSYTKEVARELWDELPEAHDDEFEWNDRMRHGGTRFYEAFWETSCRRRDPQLSAFFERSWPRLCAQIRLEIEAEKGKVANG